MHTSQSQTVSSIVEYACTYTRSGEGEKNYTFQQEDEADKVEGACVCECHRDTQNEAMKRTKSK